MAAQIDDTLISSPDLAASPQRPSQAGELGPALIAGRYEILGLLGSGGMGNVYRARDRELDEVVALKVLRRELLDSPDMVERFRQEVRLARKVTHRNVARTFDIGEHQGERFLTMELIEGEALSHRLAQAGRLPVDEVMRVAGELCAGLAAAHGAGVVHRDLKPDNVLLGSDGRVVITDFGIARAAAGRHTQAVVGTPAYMAPEQIDQSAPIDGRTDLYALGCVLYELCCGQPPWEGDTPYAMLMARLFRPPPDPQERRADLPEALARVILRCLERRPEDRFGSAAEVLQALSAVTQPVAVAAPGPATTQVTPPAEMTVAVLPIRSLGPPEDEYLASGLFEDLIDALSMTPRLKVRPRGAVMAVVAGGADADPRELGRKLGVQVVAEGSIRRIGERLRVQLRLIGTSDGFQIFSQRYDRPAADVFALSDEAAQAMARALLVDLQPARRGPADPRVQDLYLRARHEMHQVSPASVMRAADLLDQALQIAPADPDVLSLYALARARLWFFGGEGSGELARRAAEQALHHAPDRGEPHLALAAVRWQDGDLPGAAASLRRALSLAPALPEAHELLGRILIEIGPLPEGIRHLATAMELEPGLRRAVIDLGRAYALAGERELGLRLLRAHQTGGEDIGLLLTRGRLALWHGDGKEIADLLGEPEVLAGRLPVVPALHRVLTEGRFPGDPEPFIVGAFDAPHSSGRRIIFALQLLAEILCALKDPERALSVLARAVEAGLSDLIWLDHCPLLAGLREDARLSPLRAQVAARVQQVHEALGR